MNKNTITASIEFHYQGELYSAAETIDLDQIMQAQSALPSLHHLLAIKMNVGQYSYQYEMLLAEEIIFSDAKGITVEYLQDGHFDVAAFEIAWREKQIVAQLQSIASRLLGVDDIEQNPTLKNALLEAYQAGREQPK
jgi:hypothetical protein